MIDPILASTTFATIVGLICNYRQEQDAKSGAEHRTFIEWLEYHRHDEIKNLIVSNQVLQADVNKLLLEDSKQVLEKLNVINDTLSLVLSRLNGFQNIAAQLGNKNELSNDALMVLVKLDRSKSKCFIWSDDREAFIFFPSMFQFGFSDNRFVPDDIQKLLHFGFITVGDHTSDGRPMFSITRNGSTFAKSCGYELPPEIENETL